MSDSKITSSTDVYFPNAVKEAAEAHAERLQAARDEVGYAETELRANIVGLECISRLIKAHIELALLERGGG